MDLFVTNQNNTDRIIRAVVSVLLILFYFVAPSNIDNTLANIGLGISGVLLFNAVSGNCYIYRVFGISTCSIELNSNEV